MNQSADLEICDQCCGTGWMHPDDPAGRCEKCQGLGGIPKITQSAGIRMTGRIMGAVAHIVDDQPSEIVIEAMAGAMMATLVAAKVSVEDQRTVLRRYADRIVGFAGALE